MGKLNLAQCNWVNEPEYYVLTENKLLLSTSAFTDLWSKTYYQLTSHNAPLLYAVLNEDCTVTVKCAFKHKAKYDQCGLVVYITQDCWFKICVEYVDLSTSLVSTVVTMNGYSDWSSMNISSDIESMVFCLHHKGFDFKVENSFDGKRFKQMRVFHLDPLGQELKIGVYAASPLDSSFDVTFSDYLVEKCTWEEYRGE